MIAYNNQSLSARQKLVLECLFEHNGDARTIELAASYAARQLECNPSSVTEQHLRQSYSELGNTLLTELEEKGLIQYCRETGRIQVNSDEIAMRTNSDLRLHRFSSVGI